MREFSDLKPLDDIPASFFLIFTEYFFATEVDLLTKGAIVSGRKTDRAYLKDLCGNVLLSNKTETVAIRILLDINRPRHGVVPAFRVLCRNSNQVFARRQRIGKVAELAFRANHRLLAIHHHSRA
jgi:hypothetical protein